MKKEILQNTSTPSWISEIPLLHCEKHFPRTVEEISIILTLVVWRKVLSLVASFLLRKTISLSVYTQGIQYTFSLATDGDARRTKVVRIRRFAPLHPLTRRKEWKKSPRRILANTLLRVASSAQVGRREIILERLFKAASSFCFRCTNCLLRHYWYSTVYDAAQRRVARRCCQGERARILIIHPPQANSAAKIDFHSRSGEPLFGKIVMLCGFPPHARPDLFP